MPPYMGAPFTDSQCGIPGYSGGTGNREAWLQGPTQSAVKLAGGAWIGLCWSNLSHTAVVRLHRGDWYVSAALSSLEEGGRAPNATIVIIIIAIIADKNIKCSPAG